MKTQEEKRITQEQIEAYNKDLKKLSRLLRNIQNEHEELMPKEFDWEFTKFRMKTQDVSQVVSHHVKEYHRKKRQ